MARKPTNKKPARKGRVAAASLSAGSAARIGAGVITSNAIEQAMHLATMDALANGITDPKEILKLKLEARERVKAEARKAAEDAAASDG